GGLGIPIGKLSLYTLVGGIRPERTLPIVLDVGTNNAERLKDPEYLGWRHERVTGQAYFDFVDQFVQAVKQELPNTCLQWEDFATHRSDGRAARLRAAAGPGERVVFRAQRHRARWRDRKNQCDDPDRSVHRSRCVQRIDRSRDGAQSRAADHLPAVQSDLEIGGDGR